MHVARAVIAALFLAASPMTSAAPCAGFDDVSDSFSPNVVGGHPSNEVRLGVAAATISGGGLSGSGESNRVTDDYGTVSGGHSNLAGRTGGTLRQPAATVGGGVRNTASGPSSTIGGGQNNTASGFHGTVSGGASNVASGAFSTVAGGQDNVASGEHSFAAGSHANANFTGCFLWGDRSTSNEVRCDANNRFVVRSLGGVFFFSSGSTQASYNGVFLAPGATAWVVASDRRLKENLLPVDTREILDRVVALPITTWNLSSQDPSVRHMGAMAQDFRAAFGLGETELGINTLDADGVALAALQGLNAKVEVRMAAKDAEIAALRTDAASLRAEVAVIRKLLALAVGATQTAYGLDITD